MAAPDPVTWFQHRLILVALRFPWFSGSRAWFWQALTWRCRASRAPAPGTACFGVFPVPLELPVVPTRGGASFSGTGGRCGTLRLAGLCILRGLCASGGACGQWGGACWLRGGACGQRGGACGQRGGACWQRGGALRGAGRPQGLPSVSVEPGAAGPPVALEFWVLAIELRVSIFCYQELRKLQSNM